MRCDDLHTDEAVAEYRRLLTAGVAEPQARILAAEVTRRRAVRGDDERAYYRLRSLASPEARAAHAAAENVRAQQRDTRTPP